MLKTIIAMTFAAALILCATPISVHAQDDSDQATQSQDEGDDSSAAGQLDDAAQDGQEAMDAQSDEDAKAESNETFDTPHDSDGN